MINAYEASILYLINVLSSNEVKKRIRFSPPCIYNLVHLMILII